jgi:putative ribosome biogenesis GTPase RsgA
MSDSNEWNISLTDYEKIDTNASEFPLKEQKGLEILCAKIKDKINLLAVNPGVGKTNSQHLNLL